MERLTIMSLFSLEHTIAAKIFDNATYGWEILPQINGFIKALGAALPKDKFEQIGEDIWVAKSAVIAPTASVSGPCIIDEEAEIRHCAFIRGNVIIGKKCVVGNSSEIKNTVLFDYAQVPHYNYVGDSVLGYRSHLGAGAITSNLKSDKTPVTVKLDGKKIITGLKKFGAMVGDFVEIGCGSVLNPGTVVGKNTNVYPLSSVRGYIPADSIYKLQSEIVHRS